jgi:hypothetical protein
MKNNTLLKALIFLVIILIFVVGYAYVDSHSMDDATVNYKLDSLSIQHEKDTQNALITERNRQIRNNWENYIEATTNRYTYYEIGGVENLQVIITNNSDFKLDEVIVDVCYVIDDGSCYDTRQVKIYNVPAKSQKYIDAPNSNRGKNIELSITNIYSDSLNFNYSLYHAENGDDNDPYFTKK